ncbi:PAP2 superfamily [Pragia fontium]|uniref:phosphatase PAP2 family protein n=1 Tax=Pragia fontium TaxID=82985 RepID=UPI000E053610|nr:phosphatase PAP2 family protein [Pragia fontium]SUB83004.1 PAP2 superfamily [Pragia fontium]
MDFKGRLRQLIYGWGFVGIVYATTGLIQAPARTIGESFIDRLIPFSTSGIWLYCSFFLFIPAVFWLADSNRILWLRRSMQLCACFSGALFLLFPTTLDYPPVTGSDFNDEIWRLMATVDSSQNCFPSLHAALTLLCGWAMLGNRRKVYRVVASLWGIAICYSIIQTRRHLAIDLGGGIALAVISGWICLRLTHRKVRKRISACCHQEE